MGGRRGRHPSRRAAAAPCVQQRAGPGALPSPTVASTLERPRRDLDTGSVSSAPAAEGRGRTSVCAGGCRGRAAGHCAVHPVLFTRRLESLDRACSLDGVLGRSLLRAAPHCDHSLCNQSMKWPDSCLQRADGAWLAESPPGKGPREPPGPGPSRRAAAGRWAVCRRTAQAAGQRKLYKPRRRRAVWFAQVGQCGGTVAPGCANTATSTWVVYCIQKFRQWQA